MKIQLLDWKIEHLNYDIITEEGRKDNVFDLSTWHSFPEESESIFLVGFKIKVNDLNFDLNVECTFRFEVDKKITDEFKLSHFPKVNAPAIAFPFLRAFISNFTLQAGVNPVILPSINFTEINNSANGE
ncbi:protein-export chaperone SecB [Belliella aquatica]|uniref:Preprotein translocase subunit SecB n=1 Tax=Belliella aquatica TaxID=1323734 RepID=A0ABQ1LY74_9BACT|nr:protein-export chaperone SecB [Belliella aquatica]MCH7407288.1 protein-export chaperone SecB [Belliella aquatica]GGC31481.1 hypothetical protein GCM10010993_08050 [Belliella aquatica]